MKKLLTFFSAGIILSLFIIPAFLFADTAATPDNGYQMLAPIKQLQNPATGKTDIATFIPAAVKLTISIAAALAVIMIVIGGFKYIASEAFQSKSDAKQTIQNAIVGLLLAIASYSILYTINPSLVDFSLKLDYQGSSEAISTNIGTTIDTGAETTGPVVMGSNAGDPWPSDQRERTQFIKAGISINRQNCATIGSPSCTSLTGISSNVLGGLQNLASTCKCTVILTGGTEYWLHGSRNTDLSLNKTPHRPGGIVADLSLQDSNGNPTPVTNFLRSKDPNIKPTTSPSCAPGTEKYLFGGGLYVNELIAGNPPHWHVCFY